MAEINGVKVTFNGPAHIKFLKYIIGYNAFLKNETFTVGNNPKFKIKSALGYITKTDEKIYAVYLEKGDWGKSQLHIRYKSSKSRIIKFDKFFDKKICCVEIYRFMEICNAKKISNNSAKLDNNSLDYKNIINAKNPRMILGAGASAGYGSKSWDEMISDIKESSKTEMKIDDDGLNDIYKSVYNTTYGYPQILKSVDLKSYDKSIYDSVYKGEEDENKKSTLKAIAKAIAKKKTAPPILTFNYDDFLEKELSELHCIATTCSTNEEYEVNKGKSPLIIHSHGFIPRDNGENISIVFTNDEYIKAYSSKTAFSYRVLDEQLDGLCVFIGNSITDYEEQKVIKNKFDKVRSSYHFCLKKKPKDAVVKEFIEKYFFGMGILMIWFDDYGDIANFIETYL